MHLRFMAIERSGGRRRRRGRRKLVRERIVWLFLLWAYDECGQLRWYPAGGERVKPNMPLGLPGWHRRFGCVVYRRLLFGFYLSVDLLGREWRAIFFLRDNGGLILTEAWQSWTRDFRRSGRAMCSEDRNINLRHSLHVRAENSGSRRRRKSRRRKTSGLRYGNGSPRLEILRSAPLAGLNCPFVNVGCLA